MIVPIESQSEVEKALIEICLVTPRKIDDLRQSFNAYLSQRPYGAIDLARICKNQAMIGMPMPWEDDYERSVLASIFLQ